MGCRELRVSPAWHRAFRVDAVFEPDLIIHKQSLWMPREERKK